MKHVCSLALHSLSKQTDTVAVEWSINLLYHYIVHTVNHKIQRKRFTLTRKWRRWLSTMLHMNRSRSLRSTMWTTTKSTGSILIRRTTAILWTESGYVFAHGAGLHLLVRTARTLWASALFLTTRGSLVVRCVVARGTSWKWKRKLTMGTSGH